MKHNLHNFGEKLLFFTNFILVLLQTAVREFGNGLSVNGRGLKPGSQYILRDASRPEVILFQWDLDALRSRNGTRFYSCVMTCQRPLKK